MANSLNIADDLDIRMKAMMIGAVAIVVIDLAATVMTEIVAMFVTVIIQPIVLSGTIVRHVMTMNGTDMGGKLHRFVSQPHSVFINSSFWPKVSNGKH